MAVLSTSDLTLMPDIDSLRRRMQQMAALTAVFSIEYGESQFDFHPNWRRNEQMGAIKNGSGDELFAHFIPAGCFIKGFDHESEMTPYKKNPPQLWPGLLSSVPAEFQRSMKEPAFDILSTTFAIWRRSADATWSTDEVSFPDNEYGDGSSELLEPIAYTHRDFTNWLSKNYEVDVDASIVEAVFNGQPLSESQMSKLNPSQSMHALRNAVRATGYPMA
jgi:hypothetical protein